MKETVGSLRFYLIIVGVGGGLANVFAMFAGLSPLGVALVAVSMVLAGGFLYVGIRLRELLVTNPVRINQLIYANIAMILLKATLNLAYGYTNGLAQIAIGLAISVYLLSSVKRLSAQVVAEVTPVPAEV